MNILLFEQLLGFLERSEERSVRLIGGDPTLHFFDKILIEIDLPTMDSHIHIFTERWPESISYLWDRDEWP